MGVIEITKFRTSDGTEFTDETEAHQWERRCEIVDHMYKSSGVDQHQAAEAVDWLLERYILVEKK